MKYRFRAHWVLLALFFLTVSFWLAPVARTQADKHLSIYAPAASYSVQVTALEGKDYVSLSDLLEPLGKVEAQPDGKKWKIAFTPAGGHTVEGEFQDGKNKAQIHGQEFDLAGNFHFENGRGYVSAHNAGLLATLFTGWQANYREASLRLLLGNVAVTFSQQIDKSPSKLTLNFSAPVNPMVATEPGKLHLTFRREALLNAGPETLQTGDPNITSTVFTDASGNAQITVSGSVPLTASFADGNKSIIITPVANVAPQAAANTAPTAPASTPATPAATPTPAAPVGPRFVVVIDPAHGGDERGAAITETIKEKDVNLAIARRLQRELQTRNIYTILLRTADTTVPLDDRAIAVNSTRPAVYVCVHAANLGTGARIFTALMAPTAAGTHGFLPWTQAQAPFLDLSSQVAGSVSAELGNRQIAVTAFPAPLRPMRNIAAPAIAVEVAPPDGDVENINDSDYQQNLAAAIANGIVAIKPRLLGAK